jgi:hypothetical protein
MRYYIAALMLCVCTAAAQRVEIPIAVTNTVADQSKSQTITVAAHPQGTVDLDSALGEKEIPSLPPPAGVFIVYSIPPSSEYLWLSPIDIRKLEIGKQHLVEYTIGMTWNAGKIDITWGPIPNLIDSAYIVDVVSDFPNNFIKVKLEPGKSYSTINTAIAKLKVLVWYNATSLSVLESNPLLSVYPTPFDDDFIIEGAGVGAQFDVMDVAGSVIFAGVVDQQRQRISAQHLSTGLYTLRVRELDGSLTTKKLLRR